MKKDEIIQSIADWQDTIEDLENQIKRAEIEIECLQEKLNRENEKN